ncbi:uncharacterized protein RJT21DRAFT_115328 [Scheffersomyces amazonensis]|uniref:uncharacterized protein n=1 Tax=Scheffersomyces amazonensis TaxID=1078765 RepID=UPI00315DCEB5
MELVPVLKKTPSHQSSSLSVLERFLYDLKRFVANQPDSTRLYSSIQSSGIIEAFNTTKGPSQRGVRVTRDIETYKTIFTFCPISKVYDSERRRNGCQFKFTDRMLNVSGMFEYQQLILDTIIQNDPSASSHALNNEIFIIILRIFINCLINPDYYKQIMSLTSHKHEINTTKTYEQMSGICTYLSETIRLIIPIYFESVADELIDRIFNLGCICCVNFNLLINRLHEPIGICLDPTFSLINHSCLPNTVAVSDDRDQMLSLVCISDLKSGQEITTNYCFTSIPKQLRQLDLKNRFFFDCKCPLCKKRKYDWFFSYCCPYCEVYIQCLNFSNCFDQSENESDQLYGCKSCGAIIPTPIYNESKLLHQLLLAMLLTTDDPEIEITSIDQFKEIMLPFLQEIRRLAVSEHQLSELFLEKVHGFEINPQRVPIIYSIIEILIKQGIVPSFCFPISIFITNLSANQFPYPIGIKSINGKEIYTRSFHLKLELQRIFLVSIPGDITKSMNIGNSLFMKLGHATMNVLVAIFINKDREKEKEIPKILKDWIPNTNLLYSTLIRCSLFFYLQAIETYAIYSERTVDEMIGAIKQLKVLNKLACNPLPWIPRLYEEEMFFNSLLKLFNFANIHHKFYFEKFSIKLCLADGQRAVLFSPINQLYSKYIEEIQ